MDRFRGDFPNAYIHREISIATFDHQSLIQEKSGFGAILRISALRRAMGLLIVILKVAVSVCLVTSFVCYVKIFFILRHNQIQVLDHFLQRQMNQPVSLSMARYRKAVSAALWVQMTLVVSYLPILVTEALKPQRGMLLSLYLAREFARTLVLSNSSLNPLLYCWKIREVRQAVKDTMRELLCSSPN